MKTLIIALAVIISGCSSTNAERLSEEPSVHKMEKLKNIEKELCNFDYVIMTARYNSAELRMAYIRICKRVDNEA